MALIISRADVTSDRIIEDLPDRFLKVSPTKYLESIDVDPIPSQIAIINAVNKYRFVCAAISRRQGKTYIANIIGQCVALVPNSNILIMSPNYNLSMISWELQRMLIKHHHLEVEKDNAKDRVIVLENGSTIRMGSVNQVDSCVGRSYDLIIFDEAALTSEGKDAFNVSLRPTLDRDNARAIFISTPRGKTNWFAEFWNRGFDIGENGEHSEYPQWCSIKATYHDNPRMTAEDVSDAKRSMSDAEFNQEYMADFNTYVGQIWTLREEFVVDPEETIEDPDGNEVYKYPEFHPSEEIEVDMVAGLDLGFRDATAMVVIGYNFKTEIFYVLDEYYENGRTTSGYAENIQRLIEKWQIDYVYIDSAAQQTRFDFAQEYDIPTINAKKSILDGIGYVASLVDTGKLYVNKHCTYVLRSFDAYRWDPNPNLIREKPVHDDSSHMADAIRYALYSFEGQISIS
jgi:phage terminase large subunit